MVIKEVEAAFKLLPTTKPQEPGSFTGEFCPTAKKQITSILNKLPYKIKKRILPITQ